MVKVLYYSNCDSCKNALRFLKKELIRADCIDIVNEPPGVEILRLIYELSGRNLKGMFNTTGKVYAALNLKEKVPTMTPEQAFELMSANGKLIKRPILLTSNECVIGFNAQKWLAIAIKEDVTI